MPWRRKETEFAHTCRGELVKVRKVGREMEYERRTDEEGNQVGLRNDAWEKVGMADKIQKTYRCECGNIWHEEELGHIDDWEEY